MNPQPNRIYMAHKQHRHTEKTEKEQVAYRVTYRVMKGRDGNYENGGYTDFRTEEEALEFIERFKETHDGWTSDVDEEPTEIPLSEADMLADELIAEGLESEAEPIAQWIPENKAKEVLVERIVDMLYNNYHIPEDADTKKIAKDISKTIQDFLEEQQIIFYRP